MDNKELSNLIGETKSFIFHNRGNTIILKKRITGASFYSSEDKINGASKIILHFAKREDMELYYSQKGSGLNYLELYEKDKKMLLKELE